MTMDLAGMRTAACLLVLTVAATGQESFRPASQLPDAPQPQFAVTSPPLISWVQTAPRRNYTPLTNRQKADVFVSYTYAPQTFAAAAFDAGISQATSDHEGYGEGFEGYGKRFGASLADNESGVFFQRFLLPTVFGQDPRYFRRPELPTAERAAYAASRVLLTRNDSGDTAFNISYLGGALISTTLANAYYPLYERGAGQTLQRFGFGILSDAGLNVFHEFWPDLKARLMENGVFRRFRRSQVGKTIEGEVDHLGR